MKTTMSSIRAGRELGSTGVPPKNKQRFWKPRPVTAYVIFRMSPDWRTMHKLTGTGYLAGAMRSEKTWLEQFIDPDDQPYVSDIIQKTIKTKNIFELEHRLPRVDAHQAWILSRAVPLLAENGEITEWYGTASDVSERKHAEELLTEQKAKYQAVIETSADGFWMVDREGHIYMVNDAYAQRSGYSREELMSMSISDLEAQESRRDVQAHINKVIRNGSDIFETRHRAKNGEIWPLEVSVSYLETGEGLFVAFARDLTDRKALEQAAVEAAAAEQERIGRDLHDSIGQQLTAVTLLATGLLNRLKAAGHTEDARVAAELGEHIQTVLAEVRALSRGLAPIDIDSLSLGKALSELVALVVKTTDIDCRYRGPQQIDVKRESTAIHLYRIAQEAVQNAIKHAKSKRIDVILDRAGKHLVLTVSDDGKGMDRNQEHRGGFGLRILSYRCGLIGGQLSIETQEGGGTLVRCRVPLSRERQQPINFSMQRSP